jgi:DMSO/TMAO reductase YedYZ molybdopterin-dependent catalytic subunit
VVEFPSRFSRNELGIAALAGLAGVAGSYAATGYTRDFVVAPIDALVVRATPGQAVAWTIQNVGEEAHVLHIALSFAIAATVLGGAALAGIVAADRFDRPVAGSGLGGLLGWGVTTALTTRPTLAVAAGVPVALFATLATVPVGTSTPDPSRRRVLTAITGTLGSIGIAYWLGGVATREESATGGASGNAAGGAPGDVPEGVTRRLQAAEEKSLDIAGDVPGLVSSFEEFYNVDIAEFDPELSAEDWSMTITGQVDEDVEVTFEELTDMPTEHRFVTLRCVGEDLNGEKLDNAVWTGTPVEALIEDADPGGECGCAMVRAEDGYYVQFPVAALEDAFLAWGMNGQSLPKAHGHPVRVLVPGHWGETNVKWPEEIELLDEEMDGYWEKRGWHGTGPVNTVAKLWSETRLDDGNTELAGHAYAGTRGIERVEVSTDGGETWHDADLSEPLDGEDVWRQWRHEFEPDGSHEVVVRATDGEGRLQQEERTDSFPRGAAGWVSKTVSVR